MNDAIIHVIREILVEVSESTKDPQSLDEADLVREMLIIHAQVGVILKLIAQVQPT